MKRLPWYAWTSLASVACIMAGGYWDISWHMTIGRDTFWTPAHLLIQAGGLIAGCCGTYVILAATLRQAPATIRVWGFRGPLGAFLAVWGAATMAISAPFDNWWHNAYGLDVKILSPPHTVLTLGILGVAAGGVLLIVRERRDAMVIAVAGAVAVLGMTAILESTFRSNLHRAEAYRAICLVAPLGLLAFSRVIGNRWAATAIAGVYTAFMIAMLWLFAQIPAEAKLGPVYQPITHYVPLQFPMLIIVPALALDLIRPRIDDWPRWARALVYGPLFLGVLVAVEWPFASFLMSEHARNWVFGTAYQPYFMRPEWHEAMYRFMTDDALVRGFAIAAAGAVIASYLGLLVGDGMRKVRR